MGLGGIVIVAGHGGVPGVTGDRAFSWTQRGHLDISPRLALAGLVLESLACDPGARVASAVLPCLGESRGEQLGLQQERFRLDSETPCLMSGFHSNGKGCWWQILVLRSEDLDGRECQRVTFRGASVP